MYLREASSVYLAKLNQFLDGQDPQTVKWIKAVLNKIFLGIKNDFDGYREGKRPTIREYGTYKVFFMTIQAVSDVKAGSNDVKGKWNHHYLIKDYCSGMGKQIGKKFEGNYYDMIVNTEDFDETDMRSTEADALTDREKFPMVGVYCTGIGGNYKNLSKDIPGSTYSIIVSVPETEVKEYKNPFMTQSGNHFQFSNEYHEDEDGKDYFTVSFDMSDGEFTIVKSREDSADRFTIIYKRSKNTMKAFEAWGWQSFARPKAL